LLLDLREADGAIDCRETGRGKVREPYGIRIGVSNTPAKLESIRGHLREAALRVVLTGPRPYVRVRIEVKPLPVDRAGPHFRGSSRGDGVPAFLQIWVVTVTKAVRVMIDQH
jgi:hypothetical protein